MARLIELFECFISDMEWLVEVPETNEEGRFFWSLLISVLFSKETLKVVKMMNATHYYYCYYYYYYYYYY